MVQQRLPYKQKVIGSNPLAPTMHKIRNTKHLELLNKLCGMGIIPPGCREPLSKRVLRDLLVANKWDEHKVLQEIKNDEWWYRYADD